MLTGLKGIGHRVWKHSTWSEVGIVLPGMEWLPGMRPITVRVMKSTEARHLSARGSSTEPSMEDWPGNLLAM